MLRSHVIMLHFDDYMAILYIMKTQRKRIRGKFHSETEPNTEIVTIRLPASMYLSLIDASGGSIPSWVREAIAEKLAREGETRQSA